mmetsp:Transcript_14088/g.35509  ORF Transcript_14088/g.35509 Transcript_14088/m.35509 type:complete len:259 (-) Transcript_14088:966-1742(-)
MQSGVLKISGGAEPALHPADHSRHCPCSSGAHEARRLRHGQRRNVPVGSLGAELAAAGDLLPRVLPRVASRRAAPSHVPRRSRDSQGGRRGGCWQHRDRTPVLQHLPSHWKPPSILSKTIEGHHTAHRLLVDSPNRVPNRCSSLFDGQISQLRSEFLQSSNHHSSRRRGSCVVIVWQGTELVLPQRHHSACASHDRILEVDARMELPRSHVVRYIIHGSTLRAVLISADIPPPARRILARQPKTDLVVEQRLAHGLLC